MTITMTMFENNSQKTEKLHELFLIYYACFPLNLS